MDMYQVFAPTGECKVPIDKSVPQVAFQHRSPEPCDAEQPPSGQIYLSVPDI